MTTPSYFFFDETLYREADDGTFEGFVDESWIAVVPSEQDLNSMREVTPAEAQKLEPAAVS